MFTYFTQTKQLQNLLWVYAPYHDQANRSAYYPGDAYVDIVALDVYADYPVGHFTMEVVRMSGRSFQANVQSYDEMLSFHKPFALAEIGPSTTDGRFDYMRW